ncbi:MAG: DEAD/DEAH box helicase family protein, partial [Coriobacteriia bacterium]|nr:DEAD/DEAH box helicase family protein [Coriobacteriia bacterium]
MIAHVIIDRATRALDKTFAYLVPSSFEATIDVGSCVLVSFAHKKSLAFVVQVEDDEAFFQKASLDFDKTKLKELEEVFEYQAFSPEAASIAFWMAEYYGAYLSETIKLFFAPGSKLKLEKSEDGSYRLITPDFLRKEVQWLVLNHDAAPELPLAKNASRQRQILAALKEGPIKSSELAQEIPGAHQAIRALKKKGLVLAYQQREVRELAQSSLSSAVMQKRKASELTEGQKESLSSIRSMLHSKEAGVILMDGVTGSGKTEVYLQAIEEVLAQGGSACVLIPEISLTAQTVGRFRGRFGNQVAVLHSKLSAGERYDQWCLAQSGKARVVVGPRSALFASLNNLALIIIDEEHETSYKQSSGVRYHAREVAEKIAEVKGIPLVLASATPSIESLYYAIQGKHAQ